MTGQQFADDDEEVKKVAHYQKSFILMPFKKPVDQWANCIEKQGDYVEK